jgi:hypothetical protein
MDGATVDSVTRMMAQKQRKEPRSLDSPAAVTSGPKARRAFLHG